MFEKLKSIASSVKNKIASVIPGASAFVNSVSPTKASEVNIQNYTNSSVGRKSINVGKLTTIGDMFSSGLKNTEYFKPTASVRARDVLSNFPSAFQDTLGSVFGFLGEAANISTTFEDRQFGKGAVQRARNEVAFEDSQYDMNDTFSSSKFFDKKAKAVGKSILPQASSIFLETGALLGGVGNVIGSYLGGSKKSVSENFVSGYDATLDDVSSAKQIGIGNFRPFEIKDPKQLVDAEGGLVAINIAGMVGRAPIDIARRTAMKSANKLVVNAIDDVTEGTLRNASVATERATQNLSSGGVTISPAQKAYLENSFRREFSGLGDGDISNTDVFNESVSRNTATLPKTSEVYQNIFTSTNEANVVVARETNSLLNSETYASFNRELNEFKNSNNFNDNLLNAISSKRLNDKDSDYFNQAFLVERPDGRSSIAVRPSGETTRVTPLSDIASDEGITVDELVNRYRAGSREIERLNPDNRALQYLTDNNASFRNAVRTLQENRLTLRQIERYGGSASGVRRGIRDAKLKQERGRIKAEYRDELLRQRRKSEIAITTERLKQQFRASIKLAKEKGKSKEYIDKLRAKHNKEITRLKLEARVDKVLEVGKAKDKAFISGQKIGEAVGKKLGINKVVDRIATLKSYRSLFPGDASAQKQIDDMIGKSLSDGGRNLLDPFFGKLVKAFDTLSEEIIERNAKIDILREYDKKVNGVIVDAANKIYDKGLSGFTNAELESLVIAHERIIYGGEKLLDKSVIIEYGKIAQKVNSKELILTDADLKTRWSSSSKLASESAGIDIDIEAMVGKLYSDKSISTRAKLASNIFGITRRTSQSRALYKSPMTTFLSIVANNGKTTAYVAENAVIEAGSKIRDKAFKSATKAGYMTRSGRIGDALESGNKVNRDIIAYLRGNEEVKNSLILEWSQYGIADDMLKYAKFNEGVYDYHRLRHQAAGTMYNFQENYKHYIIDESLSASVRSLKQGRVGEAIATFVRGRQSGMEQLYTQGDINKANTFGLSEAGFQKRFSNRSYLQESEDPLQALSKYVYSSELVLHAKVYEPMMEDVSIGLLKLENDMHTVGFSPKEIKTASENLSNFFKFNVEGLPLDVTFGRKLSQDSGFYTALDSTRRVINTMNLAGNPASFVSMFAGEIVNLAVRAAGNALLSPIKTSKYLASRMNITKGFLAIERDLVKASYSEIIDEMANVVTLGKSDFRRGIRNNTYKPGRVRDLLFVSLQIGISKTQKLAAVTEVLSAESDIVKLVRKKTADGMSHGEILSSPDVIRQLSRMRISIAQAMDGMSAVRSGASEEVYNKVLTMYLRWAGQIIGGITNPVRYAFANKEAFAGNDAIADFTKLIAIKSIISGSSGLALAAYISSKKREWEDNTDRNTRLDRLKRSALSNASGIFSITSQLFNSKVGSNTFEEALRLQAAFSFLANALFKPMSGAAQLYLNGATPEETLKALGKEEMNNFGAIRFFNTKDVKKTMSQSILIDRARSLAGKADEIKNSDATKDVSLEEKQRLYTDYKSSIINNGKMTESEKELMTTYAELISDGQDLDKFQFLYGSQDFSNYGKVYSAFISSFKEANDKEDRVAMQTTIYNKILKKPEQKEKWRMMINFYKVASDEEKNNFDIVMGTYTKNRSVRRDRMVDFMIDGLEEKDKQERIKALKVRSSMISQFIGLNDEEREYLFNEVKPKLDELGVNIVLGDSTE